MSVLSRFLRPKVSSSADFIHPFTDHNFFNLHKLKWFRKLQASPRNMATKRIFSKRMNQKVLTEPAHERMESESLCLASVRAITECTSMNRLIFLCAQHVSERGSVAAAAFKACVYLLFSNLWLHREKRRCPRLDHLYSLFVIRPTVTSSLLRGW